jgi:hypothetical protein
MKICFNENSKFCKNTMKKSTHLSTAAPSQSKSRKQHGSVPSSELVPLQFRMTPDFVKSYKQAALDRDMKLNELLKHVFDEFMQTAKNI